VGKVRTSHIKGLSRKLLERFPDKFGSDFEKNKMIVDTLTDVTSTKLRNKVAGYVTHLVKISSGPNLPVQET
jgi:small subunit ribosomal protein S17e